MRHRCPQRRAIGLWNGDESPENTASRARYRKRATAEAAMNRFLEESGYGA